MSSEASEDAGFLSRAAFDEACQALTRSPGLRCSIVKVEICKVGNHQYLRMIRPLDPRHFPYLQLEYTKHSYTTQDSSDNHEFDGFEDEEEDVAIYHPPPPAISSAEYHILYSMSYRVPVLHFFLHHHQAPTSQSIDTVYEHLVPKYLEPGLRNVGVMGGIGMVNHPLTDIPCFWVHPCNSAEAMRSILGGINRDISPLEYLILWVGVVGNAVGLSLPKEIVLAGRVERKLTADIRDQSRTPEMAPLT